MPNLVTRVTAETRDRIKALLAGAPKKISPVRWVSLVCQKRARTTTSFAEAYAAPYKRATSTIRLVAFISEPQKRGIRFGRLSESAWVRAAILEALDAALLPDDVMKKAPDSPGEGHVVAKKPPGFPRIGVFLRDLADEIRSVKVPAPEIADRLEEYARRHAARYATKAAWAQREKAAARG